MNKDFSQLKLLSFDEHKQIKVLYDLATFIEKNKKSVSSSSFEKLSKYHHFLDKSSSEKIQKLNKEFFKIKEINYQFQIYIMNLERLLGQSKKEYEFLVQTQDHPKSHHNKNEVICILDSVRSAHNIGSMFRNAECFNIKRIILSGLCARADHPQVIKTAMGTQEIVSWYYSQDIQTSVKDLKRKGYQVWSIETAKEGLPLHKMTQCPEKLVLIFGHEQFGVSYELLQLSDQIINIELFGHKNSLNVSVCQGIILHHFTHLIK